MGKKITLLLIDIASLYLSLFITLDIRYGSGISEELYLHLTPFSIIFILWLIVFYIVNLYDVVSIRNNANFYSSLLRGIAISTGISIAAFYLIPIFIITPKTNLFIFIIIVSLMLVLFRSLINRLFERGFKNPVLIVGLSPQAIELAGFIKNNPQLGYELNHIINVTSGKDTSHEVAGLNIVEGLENIDQLINREKINTIVIGPEAYQINEVIDVFYKSLNQRMTFRNLSSFYEHLTNRVPLGAINQIWFLENLSEGSKLGYEVVRRILDVMFSVFLILVCIFLFPLIIIAIKLDSSGPIFYRQKRYGQLGKIFEIFKFRTMVQDAEQKTGAVWASENDPRITKIGRILRKSRLDELPQIWNIIRGDMSFVGPRAERPEFHDKLKQNVPFYEERYLIKPGLTGWAQINFRYGSSINDAAQKLQYDLFYIKNRSLILDLGIVLKTINIALRQAGR